MNLNKKLQILEQKCSKHWLQQIKKAISTDDDSEVEYLSYSLLRFFRYLEDSEIQIIRIDGFYHQIINFIKNTETINEKKNSENLHFFRSVSHIIISDYYRGFDELSRITLNSFKGQEESNDFLFQIIDVEYIKLACLTFFKRYDEALLIIHKINNNHIQHYDEMMLIDTKIRQSFILLMLKRNRESIEMLTETRNINNIDLYPFITTRDIDFQIGSLYFNDCVAGNNEMLDIGFDILMKLASQNPSIVFFQISYTYAFNDKYDKALSYILQIEKNSRSYAMNLFLSFVLYKLNRFPESYEILKELLKYSQFSESVCELIGLIFLKCGNINQAIQFLQNAHVLDETNKTYALNYGLSLEIQEDTSELAEKFYNKMMKISYLWETYANRSCILNFNKKDENKKYFLKIIEPQLEDIILSPAQDQIEKLFQSAPYMPSNYFSSINGVQCVNLPISPLHKRISIFPM